jgi:uncharacterized protein with NRDE domain
MCLIAIAWRTHPDYRLFVAANRDEWHDRPAAPAQWWKDSTNVFAGRDLQAGGTWLGVTRDQKFAAITNFRDPSDRKSTAPSRGKLVADYLRGTLSPAAYLNKLRPTANQYNGFNLLVADQNTLLYFSSRDDVIVEVEPGIHALSNHSLNEPWPKVEYVKSSIGEAFEAKMPEDALFIRSLSIFSNENRADDERLPETGVGLEWERILSPVMIVGEQDGAKYGTRCTTIVGIKSHEVRFEEHTRNEMGTVIQIARETISSGQQLEA